MALHFLKKLQKQKPIPTIICSSLVTEGSSKAIDSLRLGACDIILKPEVGLHNSIDDISDEFITKIKAAAISKSLDSKTSNIQASSSSSKNTNKIIGIGSSTGGVQTLEKIFIQLQANHAPIVVVQHMPAGFTLSFSQSLNKVCPNSIIKEAKEGDLLSNGHIFIAPGNKHIEVKKHTLTSYIIVLKDYPKVSGHKPSVDVLFTSFSKEVRENAVAFILTGMGKDGAVGIKKSKKLVEKHMDRMKKRL